MFDLSAWAGNRSVNLEKLQRSPYELDHEVVEMLGLARPAGGSRPGIGASHLDASEAADLRAELAAIRASRSFRVGNALAKAYRRLRGRPLD